MSGVLPRLINAESQGIEQASTSIGLSLQPQSQQGKEVTAESQGPDVVLLSSRFNEEPFSDEIVGEIMNNGTESAEYVEALTTFRDTAGAVIDTASGYADPHLVVAKDSAPFKMLLTSDNMGDEAMSYDLTLKWQDLDSEEFSKDVLKGQPLSGDNDNDDGNDSGGDNDDDGSGCDSNLECQLEGNREWAKDHIGNFDELSDEDQESAISDVLNDVDEDYLHAQQEKENQIDGEEEQGSDDGGGKDEENED